MVEEEPSDLGKDRRSGVPCLQPPRSSARAPFFLACAKPKSCPPLSLSSDLLVTLSPIVPMLTESEEEPLDTERVSG